MKGSNSANTKKMYCLYAFFYKIIVAFCLFVFNSDFYMGVNKCFMIQSSLSWNGYFGNKVIQYDSFLSGIEGSKA